MGPHISPSEPVTELPAVPSGPAPGALDRFGRPRCECTNPPASGPDNPPRHNEGCPRGIADGTVEDPAAAAHRLRAASTDRASHRCEGSTPCRECGDVEVTVTMRVPMSESTYRKLKAAASLRGVGQGQLAAQIIEESLPQFMNFGPGGESFPFERPSA